MENLPPQSLKKTPGFKTTALFFLYLYLAVMVFAFIFCSLRNPHPVGLTMETVQALRMQEAPSGP